LIKIWFRQYFELAFWVAALFALALSDPNLPGQYSLCPFRLIGITWCPGCGIGHAIAYLLHGEMQHSLKAHWLGIPALLIIVYRIFILLRRKLDRQNPFGYRPAEKS
jgi:hypothetical protein